MPTFVPIFGFTWVATLGSIWLLFVIARACQILEFIMELVWTPHSWEDSETILF